MATRSSEAPLVVPVDVPGQALPDFEPLTFPFRLAESEIGQIIHGLQMLQASLRRQANGKTVSNDKIKQILRDDADSIDALIAKFRKF